MKKIFCLLGPFFLVYNFPANISSNAGNQDLNNSAEQQNRKELPFLNKRKEFRKWQKKRANNEGSIYQRPNGKWRAQVTIDGRRLSFTADTQRQGLAWLLETKNQIDSGLTFQATDTTLKEFLGEWLTTVSSSSSKGTYFT
jgi:hypothetical protein